MSEAKELRAIQSWAKPLHIFGNQYYVSGVLHAYIHERNHVYDYVPSRHIKTGHLGSCLISFLYLTDNIHYCGFINMFTFYCFKNYYMNK